MNHPHQMGEIGEHQLIMGAAIALLQANNPCRAKFIAQEGLPNVRIQGFQWECGNMKQSIHTWQQIPDSVCNEWNYATSFITAKKATVTKKYEAWMTALY